MLQAANNANLIKGFCPANDDQVISHLQFTDTLLFCDTNEFQLLNVKAILLCLEAVSGLRVNFFKSEMIGVRVEDTHLASLADILGCKVGSLPSSYLGLPLCIEVASKALRSPMIERMEKRLSLWKANYLSLGGRITLIKAALANLPIYFMSMFRCPMEVIKHFEKLQRDFLWHGNV